jgi:site-specific DNA recombinase
VPATEIEQFVLDRIRCVGKDPGLLSEMLGQAQEQGAETSRRLEAEQEALGREVKKLNADLRGLSGACGRPWRGLQATADILPRLHSSAS